MQAFYRDLSYPYGLENALQLAGTLKQGLHLRHNETIIEPPTTPPYTAHTSERSQTRTQGHIVVYDDDEAIRNLLAQALERKGFTVTCRHSFLDDKHDFGLIAETADALILDRHIGQQDGLSFLQRLREEIPCLPVVLISGHPLDPKEQRKLASLNADFFAKPFQVRELVRFLLHCLTDIPSPISSR